jgi:lipopolysaccharide biosynthesis glycosyltransferase
MKTVLVTSFDANYWEQSIVALHSFISNTDTDNYDVACIVSKDILHREQEYSDTLGHIVRFVYTDKVNALIDAGVAKEDHWVPVHCYQRIFLGSLLDGYDKCIYIDPDTLTVRNTSPIFKYPPYAPVMAAMEDLGHNKTIFNTDDIPYFNNGVMIVDLKYWNEADIEDKLVEWIVNNGPTMTQEQDAMNAVLLNAWFPLPTSFNTLEFMLYMDPYFAESHTNPLILHYLGPVKPWSKDARIYEWTQRWIDYYKTIFMKGASWNPDQSEVQ